MQIRSLEDNLFQSIKENNLTNLMECLNHNPDLTKKNSHGNSPIIMASLLKNWNFVELMLNILPEESCHIAGLNIALHCAVTENQDQLVKLLISKKANFTAYDTTTGYKVLHVAIENENYQIAKLLLDHKADVSEPTQETLEEPNVKTPLEIAVLKKNVKFVSVLLSRGANPLQKTAKNKLVLDLAARNKKWSCVEKIIAKIPAEHKEMDALSYPLAYAAEDNQIDIVQLLLYKKAKVDSLHDTVNGYYDLHFAVKNKNLPLTKLLLEYKSNPSIKTKITLHNKSEKVPLEIAIENDDTHIISLLIKHGAEPLGKNKKDELYIYHAAKQQKWKSVRELLKYIPNDHKCGSDLGLVLVHAAGEKINNITEALIEKGAALDTAFKAGTGFYAFHLAIADKNFSLIKKFLDYGANVNKKTALTSKNHDQLTPLELAIKINEPRIVELLLQTNKVDPFYKNLDRHTAIEFAANLKHWDCVKQILQYVPEKNTHGNVLGSILKSATDENQNEIVRLLLQKGANVSVQFDDAGLYDLHSAIANKNIGIVNDLLEYKADPNIATKLTAKNFESKTALMLARTANQNEILKLLATKIQINEEKSRHYFIYAHSYDDAFQQMAKFIDANGFDSVIEFLQKKKDVVGASLFQLAFLNHLMTYRNHDASFNIFKYFEEVQVSGHPATAEAVIHMIDHSPKLNNCVKLEMLQVQKLQNNSLEQSIPSFSRLNLLERKHLDSLKKNHNKDVLHDLAAVKFVKKKVLSNQYLADTIAHEVAAVFGEKVIYHLYFFHTELFNHLNHLRFALNKHPISHQESSAVSLFEPSAPPELNPSFDMAPEPAFIEEQQSLITPEVEGISDEIFEPGSAKWGIFQDVKLKEESVKEVKRALVIN